MPRLSGKSRWAEFALLLVSCAVFSGCAAHAEYGYRVYDPGYRDYHVWDANEGAYYSRWEGETHRNHEDFRKRSAADQKEYWQWRHNQH